MTFLYKVFDKLLLAGLIVLFLGLFLVPGTRGDATISSMLHDCVIGALGVLYGIIRGEMGKPPDTSSATTDTTTTSTQTSAPPTPEK